MQEGFHVGHFPSLFRRRSVYVRLCRHRGVGDEDGAAASEAGSAHCHSEKQRGSVKIHGVLEIQEIITKLLTLYEGVGIIYDMRRVFCPVQNMTKILQKDKGT